MNITQDMVDEFNSALAMIQCGARLKLEPDTTIPSCQIVMANSRYVDSYILNMNDEFYDILERYFTEKGITLSYNNTKDIFWSKP